MEFLDDEAEVSGEASEDEEIEGDETNEPEVTGHDRCMGGFIDDDTEFSPIGPQALLRLEGEESEDTSLTTERGHLRENEARFVQVTDKFFKITRLDGSQRYYWGTFGKDRIPIEAVIGNIPDPNDTEIIKRVEEMEEVEENRAAEVAIVEEVAQLAEVREEVPAAILNPSKKALHEHNGDLDAIKEAIRNGHTSINKLAKYWVSVSDDYPNTLEGRMEYKDKLVEMMNDWFGVVTLTSRENVIACRYIDGDGRYSIYYKGVGSFQDILHAYNVPMLSDKDVFVVKNWKKGGLRTFEEASSKKRKQPPEVHLIEINIASLWLKSDKKCVYGRVIFNPTPTYLKNDIPKDALNLWRGFAYSRNEVINHTDWYRLAIYFNHIRFTLCDNDAEFNYVIAWMAHMFQIPWRKPGVGIIADGKQGTGKGSTCIYLGKLIGSAFSHIQDPEDFLGNWTSQIEDKLLIYADECFLPREGQAAVSKMKTLITEETSRRRNMRENPGSMQSFARFFCASNFPWLILEEENRRYLVLNSALQYLQNSKPYSELLETTPTPDSLPSIIQADKGVIVHRQPTSDTPPEELYEEKKEKDARYWSLFHQMMTEEDNATLKTLANFLYNVPIENFDPRKVPLTSHMGRQVAACLPALQAWWFDCLTMKCISVEVQGGEQVIEWPAKIPAKDLWEHYKASDHFANKSGKKDRSAPNSTACFYNSFRDNTGVKLAERRSEVGNATIVYMVIPPLEECRRAFEIKVPGTSSFWNKSTDSKDTAKRLRCQALTDDIWSAYFPGMFYGHDIMDQFNKDTFKVRNEAEWKEYLLNSPFLQGNLLGEKTDYPTKAIDKLKEAREKAASNPFLKDKHAWKTLSSKRLYLIVSWMLNGDGRGLLDKNDKRPGRLLHRVVNTYLEGSDGEKKWRGDAIKIIDKYRSAVWNSYNDREAMKKEIEK